MSQESSGHPILDTIGRQAVEMMHLGEELRQTTKRLVELERENDRLREALTEIIWPVRFLYQRSMGEGLNFDAHAACRKAGDNEYLRDIARAALGLVR